MYQKVAKNPRGFLSFCAVLMLSACTGTEPLTLDHDPPIIVTEGDYRRAEQLLSWNVESSVWYSHITPEWIDGDRFWYRVRTEHGFRFYTVDPGIPEKREAFDHEALARALDQVLERMNTPDRLPFASFRFIAEETAIRFRAEEQNWECDIQRYQCKTADTPDRPEDSVLSPDEQWAAFIRDYNLWVRHMETGEEFSLTTDGVYRYGYATNSQGWFRSDRPVLHWSPDSRKIATYRLDERGVEEMYLLEMAQGRPVLDAWPYALPGDSVVPMHERVVLDVENRTVVRLDVEPAHQRTSNCCGLERGEYWADIDWSGDASRMAFVNTSRDYRRVDLYVADTETGAVQHIYSETANTFFESNLSSRGVPNWRVLFDHDRFVWFSRRDGWGHLYYHRLNDGEQLGRITSGNWNVLDLLHIDPESGEFFFTAVGKESGRDPYLTHFYKVRIETDKIAINGNNGGMEAANPGTEPGAVEAGKLRFSHPELLTPEEAEHGITVSLSGRFFVDEYSTFQQPPVTVLRRSADGTVLRTLEEADITRLEETAWTAPEPFVVKARDGQTDLYGIMFRPSQFDPSRSYPVIVNVYPGPQTGSVGSRSFSANRRGQSHALTELGFIVVQIDALGTPLRSKSFHTAWYGDMSDNGIEDQISAIQQLAERYQWIDAGKAGIYGHSGGGYATVSALLRFPGVFKAGVAGAGNMDNRGYTYYWGEKYQGPRIVEDGHDSFAGQAIYSKAARLEDHLLLSYGTTDSNVHPNMTLLLINELVKENKDFDMIVMPNRGHGYANEAYYIRQTWDFFVRHLLDTEPPREYKIQ